MTREHAKGETSETIHHLSATYLRQAFAAACEAGRRSACW